MKMHSILSATLATALFAALVLPASAETLPGKTAKKYLYSPNKVAVEVANQPFFVDNQAQIVGQAAAQQPYYGAIAVSPDDGLLSEATIAAANYHSTGAASVNALGACDAARKGKTPCVIVAVVRPEGWQTRPVQLSSEATAAFRKDYAGKGGALAVSANTGAWGMSSGDGAAAAALAACNSKLTDKKDCSVIISD